MSKAVLIIDSEKNRQQAIHWLQRNKLDGMRVTFQGPQRSLDQNAKLHAMLTEVATQVEHYGQKRSVTAWKYLFMDALSKEMEILPNLDGNGFVSIGRSTSDLSKSQMADMIELVFKYGAEHGVTFKDTPPPAEPTK